MDRSNDGLCRRDSSIHNACQRHLPLLVRYWCGRCVQHLRESIRFNAFGWKFYFFCVAWIVVEFVVVYWACPETMGTSLEDVALVLEGSEAKVSKINPVVEAIAEEDKTGRGDVAQVEKT